MADVGFGGMAVVFGGLMPGLGLLALRATEGSRPKPGRRANAAPEGSSGGDAGARELFDRLTKGGGTGIAPPDRAGKTTRIPDGSVIGYRPAFKGGLPTMDVNVSGLDQETQVPWELNDENIGGCGPR